MHDRALHAPLLTDFVAVVLGESFPCSPGRRNQRKVQNFVNFASPNAKLEGERKRITRDLLFQSDGIGASNQQTTPSPNSSEGVKNIPSKDTLNQCFL